MVRKYAMGGLVSPIMPKAEPAPMQLSNGGMVGKYANGGMARAAGGGMMSNGRIVGGYSMGGMVPQQIAGIKDKLKSVGYGNIPVYDMGGRGKTAFEKIGENIPKPGKYSKYSMGGMVKAAGGGMMSNGQIIGGYSMGGMVPKYDEGMVPRYYAGGGLARGTDTVPAMLTPGEFVIKKSAVDRIGTSALTKINNGYADGGLVGASAGGGSVNGISKAEPTNSVYNNTYEINVNVRSESNPEEIARTVLSRIKQVDNQRVRGINGR